MKSFISGIDGFIGSWLSRQLIDAGDEVTGLSRFESGERNGTTLYKADLTDAAEVMHIIKRVQPDRLFHLAAQSNIPASFQHPQETIDINVNGSLNLLEAIRSESPKTVFVSVGSSAEYGLTAHTQSVLREDMPLLPSSPYGISKAAQGYCASLYHRAYGIQTIHVRPFAIIGPGKTGDALYDFCKGIIDIENGKSRQLTTGNLEATRDFIDVRDMVSLLIALSEKGAYGETYNICSGTGASLVQILDILHTLTIPFEQVQDSSRMRPADDRVIIGDASKLTTLHCTRQYTLEQTIKDTLEYWRKK